MPYLITRPMEVVVLADLYLVWIGFSSLRI